MAAWVDYLTVHTWYWMQPWRAASSARGARRTKLQRGFLPSEAEREDASVAARLGLPPGVLFAGRLGLDLGIDTNLALGGRRQ